MKAGGKIGENILMVKISTYTIITEMPQDVVSSNSFASTHKYWANLCEI